MNELEKMSALRMQQIANSVAACLPTNEQIMTSMQAAMAQLMKAMDFDHQAVTESARGAILELEKNMPKMEPEAVSKIAESLTEVFRSVSSGDEVSVEKAEAVIEEVKPYLPTEAVETIEERIRSEKRSKSKISWKTVMEIISFIICVLGLIKDCLPDEYKQKQEVANTVIIANQEEMLDLQKQELKHSEEFCQHAEEHFEITEEFYERIAQALEMLADQGIESDQKSQKLADLADLPDDSPEEKALNETRDAEN